MTRSLLVAAVTAFVATIPFALPAGAQDIPRPPMVLSPDLTDPWVVQLQPGQPRPQLVPPRANRATLFTQPATAGRRNALAPTLITIPGRPAVPAATAEQRSRAIAPEFLPRMVMYPTTETPGTIVINTVSRHLYLVMEGGQALRYGVGVGRPGFEWAGVHKVTRKAEWPSWRPPAEMLQRQPELPRFMEGGPNNPLGARALYLGSTLYRIHGSNEPWTIGQAVSSGCIRMRNEDVVDLYARVGVGTRVIVI